MQEASPQAPAAVPLTAMAIAPIQLKTAVRAVRLDAAQVVRSNAVPIAQQDAKPLAPALALMDAAPFAVVPANHHVGALVHTYLLVQVVHQVHAQPLVVTIAIGPAHWLAARTACHVASLLQNEMTKQPFFGVKCFDQTVNCIDTIFTNTCYGII